MAWSLLILAALFAVVNWMAVAFGWRQVRYVTKPLVILALMAWLWLLSGWKSTLLWYGLALTFSLAGDILLLLPPRFFIPGLTAFLLGHLAYLVGLTANLKLSIPVAGLLLLGGGGLVTVLLPRIFASLRSKPGGSKLIPPVMGYSLVLTTMMLLAVSTFFRSDWNTNAAALTGAGGVLFFTSDLLLAFDRFVKPVRHGALVIMVTYHLAQIALVGGALLQFGR